MEVAQVSKTTDQVRAIEALRERLPAGSEVYAAVTHVSRSGMMRRVRATMVLDGKIVDITGSVARAIGQSSNDQGIKVGGCGFDARHEVVYSLSYALHGKGFVCVGDGCPSNDHSNGDRDYTPHQHSEGGYSLKVGRL